jgi:hypothetical protein
MGRSLHVKFGEDGTVSEFFTIFFKQNPPSRAAAMMSSSVTSHRAYTQNNSGVARNLQAKFGADRTVPELSTIF